MGGFGTFTKGLGKVFQAPFDIVGGAMGGVTQGLGGLFGGGLFGGGDGGLMGGAGLGGGLLNMTGLPQMLMTGLIIFIGVKIVFRLIDKI